MKRLVNIAKTLHNMLLILLPLSCGTTKKKMNQQNIMETENIGKKLFSDIHSQLKALAVLAGWFIVDIGNARSGN